MSRDVCFWMPCEISLLWVLYLTTRGLTQHWVSKQFLFAYNFFSTSETSNRFPRGESRGYGASSELRKNEIFFQIPNEFLRGKSLIFDFFLFSSSFPNNFFSTKKTPKQLSWRETRCYNRSIDRKLNENFLKFHVKFDGEND